MNPCPHKLRTDLPPLTARLAKLPIDKRGYPVPFFVSYVNGEPEFRAADARKWRACIQLNLCWVCGQPLGKFKTFTIGPMCAITRTTAEPPEHLECAEWSVRGCPFMVKPQMVRREGGKDFEAVKAVSTSVGLPLDRNPGVMCVWTTTTFKLFADQSGRKRLIEVGEPVSISWYREGRAATRAEIEESIRTGMPFLLDACKLEKPSKQAAARGDLEARVRVVTKLLPP